jgi:pimeloyl-ACP methyl ester carboxylesterase
LGGVFSTGMNQLQSTLEKEHRVRAESTVWYKANALSHFIIEHYGSKKLPGPIVLVGHSLGANEQIKVAQALAKKHIPVALLMTVDAVSPLEVPSNVRQVVNIYKPSFVPLFSGMRIKAMDPSHTKVENIDVDHLGSVKVNHFTIEKNKEIQKLMLEKTLTAISKSEQKKIV